VLKKILIISFFSLILRWQSWGLPLNRDEGAYAYMATRFFDSDFVLYKDAFEHKPPGIHLLYWIGFQIFGESQLSVRILSFINSVVSTLIIINILEIVKVKKKFLLVGFYMLMANSFVLEGLVANTEMFMVTFLMLSLLLVIQKRLYVLAGFLAGFSFLIKPIAFTNIGVLVILLIFLKSKLLAFAKFGAGLAVPVAAVIIYFYFRGAWGAFWESVVVFNRIYVSSGIENVVDKVGLVGIVTRGNLLMNMLLVSALVLGFVYRKKLNNQRIFFLLWLAAYWIAAKLTSRDVLHYYFPIISAGVLVFGVFWQERQAPKIFFVNIFIFLSLWGYLWFINPRSAYTKTFGSTVRYAYEGREIGFEIKERTSKEDLIFLWIDEPEILFYSNRNSTSRHLNTFGTLIPVQLEVLKNGLSKKPKVMVTYGGQEEKWFLEFLSENKYKIESKYSIARIYWREQ